MNHLKQICKVNLFYEGNPFVGIRIKNDNVLINFPMGYNLSEDEKGLRKDVKVLIKILNKFNSHNKGETLHGKSNHKNTVWPIGAYQRLISEYLRTGIYHEREMRNKKSTRGKINWSKTIKHIKPMWDDQGESYTEFIVRENAINKETLFSVIHEYGVYISLKKLGWLYNVQPIKKPNVPFNKKMFLAAILNKQREVFDDGLKALLKDLFTVISDFDSEEELQQEMTYGTYRFEYVWEQMIDYAYGINDKSDYFPSTVWDLKLNLEQSKVNSKLEPDTIMLHDNCVFVLDAKYYKYGISGYQSHLPESSSIHKQITYGEYVECKTKMDKRQIFNAFILPFNNRSEEFNTESHYKSIGIAYSNWKENTKCYEFVVGMLIDITWIMKNISRHEEEEMKQLAEIIKNEVFLYTESMFR